MRQRSASNYRSTATNNMTAQGCKRPTGRRDIINQNVWLFLDYVSDKAWLPYEAAFGRQFGSSNAGGLNNAVVCGRTDTAS